MDLTFRESSWSLLNIMYGFSPSTLETSGLYFLKIGEVILEQAEATGKLNCSSSHKSDMSITR